jgi:hypothetical protein
VFNWCPAARTCRVLGVAVGVLASGGATLTVHTQSPPLGAVVRTREGSVHGLTDGKVEQLRLPHTVCAERGAAGFPPPNEDCLAR